MARVSRSSKRKRSLSLSSSTGDENGAAAASLRPRPRSRRLRERPPGSSQSSLRGPRENSATTSATSPIKERDLAFTGTQTSARPGSNRLSSRSYIPRWKRLGLRVSKSAESCQSVSPSDEHRSTVTSRPRRAKRRISYAEPHAIDDAVEEDCSEYSDSMQSGTSEIERGDETQALKDIPVHDDEDVLPKKSVQRKCNRGPDTPKDSQASKGLDLNLPPLDNVDNIFLDMAARAIALGLGSVLEKRNGQPISIGTMCSGTEAPLIALELLSRALGRQGHPTVVIKHEFSAELDVVKQAFIERNFQPPILFRDVREFRDEVATTAYGAEEKIPQKLDILISGFVCKDLSRLNNFGKDIDDGGESGDTWRSLVSYVKHGQPSVVLVENVQGSADIWNKLKKCWKSLGYSSAWTLCDSKDYYLPQTRKRMYMIAIKESAIGINAKEAAEAWRSTIHKLERRCSSHVDAFLTARPTDTHPNTAYVYDAAWVLSKLRYDQMRSEERLGICRPITRWSEDGTIRPPDFANRQWYKSQSSRVYDCIDIAHLQAALVDRDSLYKILVWDVSQNVDRFRANIGIAPCITPGGCSFVSNKQTGLNGAQLLLLQGMPCDKLLFAGESQKEIQDLAGNAMSTTVIGASIISALITASPAFYNREAIASGPSETLRQTRDNDLVLVTHSHSTTIEPVNAEALDTGLFIHEAIMGSRLCSCEDTQISKADILKCQECGHCACSNCSGNPVHYYDSWILSQSRKVLPAEFEHRWRTQLPAQLRLSDFPSISDIVPHPYPQGTELLLFIARIEEVRIKTQTFTMSRFNRGDSKWIVVYESSEAFLELHVQDPMEWFVYVKCAPSLAAKDPLRKTLEHPVARGIVGSALLNPRWEIWIPRSASTSLKMMLSDEKSTSWRNKLGLLDYKNEMVPECIKIVGDAKLHGNYRLLPHCGTAMSSLYKRSDSEQLFLFFDPDPIGPSNQDFFVFSKDLTRRTCGKARIIRARVESSWRPWSSQDDTSKQIVSVVIPGTLVPVDMTLEVADITLKVNIPSTTDISALVQGDCSQAITILNVRAADGNPIATQRFSEYLWLLSRVKMPTSMSSWQKVKCGHRGSCVCSPPSPKILWSVNSRNVATAHEDRRASALFERSVHNMPKVIDVRSTTTQVSVSVNLTSLLHRIMGRSKELGNLAWRIVVDQVAAPNTLPRFRLISNAKDELFTGPLGLKHDLFPAQLRSLTWMRMQELGRPLTIVEIEEAVHANLGWRVEARAEAKKSVRGGVLADLPSFGKTVTTIALIQSEFMEKTADEIVADNATTTLFMPRLIPSAATLIVCPSHIAGQWQSEFQKFLSHEDHDEDRIILIDGIRKLEKMTDERICNARVVILSWALLCDEDYIAYLGNFTAMPQPATMSGRAFEAWLDNALNAMPAQTEAFRSQDRKSFVKATRANFEARLENQDFNAAVPLKVYHGSRYQSTKAGQKAGEKGNKKIPNFEKQKWPPLLQRFIFNRIVVDEYHYLTDQEKNFPALAMVKRLQAVKKWALSGTPALSDFSDVNQIAALLGVNLGREVIGLKASTGADKRSAVERTKVEDFRSRTELFSYQWHEARHNRAQAFLGQFVRQNEPQLQDILCSEFFSPVRLGVSHRTVHLELEQHLIAQRMQIKRLKKGSASDRNDRLNKTLDGSTNAEEALLKSAMCFETDKGASGLDTLLYLRREQREETEDTISGLFAEAERLEKTSQDPNKFYAAFKHDVLSGCIVGDDGATQILQRLLRQVAGEKTMKKKPPGNKTSRSAQEKGSFKKLGALSSDLRTRSQELELMVRSERFVLAIQGLLTASTGTNTTQPQTFGCSSRLCKKLAQISDLFVIPRCGHTACAACLGTRPDPEACVYDGCNSFVQPASTIRAVDLASTPEITPERSFGRKLDTVAEIIKIIPDKEQSIIFTPNLETVTIVQKLLRSQSITHVALSKSKSKAASKEIERFISDTDKKVLILNLSDESAAGVNLTNANHVIFISPLLAPSQHQYEAAMAQAIARCRRYGQKKHVHVYHFAALYTIDVNILEHRFKRSCSIVEQGSEMRLPGAQNDKNKQEKMKVVNNQDGCMALVPISWLADPKKRKFMKLGDKEVGFASLVEFSEVFAGDEE